MGEASRRAQRIKKGVYSPKEARADEARRKRINSHRTLPPKMMKQGKRLLYVNSTLAIFSLAAIVLADILSAPWYMQAILTVLLFVALFRALGFASALKNYKNNRKNAPNKDVALRSKKRF